MYSMKNWLKLNTRYRLLYVTKIKCKCHHNVDFPNFIIKSAYEFLMDGSFFKELLFKLSSILYKAALERATQKICSMQNWLKNKY